ncbi:MAG: hypothetical protein L6R45_31840 [Anaerolineae bacterium]|nr:hypothetical protein [Anaerolineae bacterium]
MSNLIRVFIISETPLYRSDHIKIRNVQDLLRLIKGDWAEQSQPDVELD